MIKELRKGELAGVLVDSILYIVATIYLTVQAINIGWPVWVPIFLWTQLAILVVLFSMKKINPLIPEFAFVTFTDTAIFACGIYHTAINTTTILLIGSLVMAFLFNRMRHVMWSQFLCNLFLIIYAFIPGKYQLETSADYFELVSTVIILNGIAIALIFFIYRAKAVDKKLSDAYNQAKLAEKSKTDFLANMSHEIRTPMNAIIGMCELILREKDLSNEVRGFCYNIQNAGRSLLSIINDILDFSKIESGKMDIVEEEFNIASTMNDVMNMAYTRMGDKKLELIVNIDPDIPRGLLGDELRIRQVMINLITNAIKYTNEGAVVINVSQIRREYGINLNVSVKDTGIGITPENLEKLFSSFSQVDTKKNRAVEGTGLGLAISKRLIKNMNGFINVKSEPDKGSEFSFVIPLKVVDNAPFIRVENGDDIIAVSYWDPEQVTNPTMREFFVPFVRGIGDVMHLDYRTYADFLRLQKRLEIGDVTHCFIGRSEFLSHREYFETMANKLEVVVVQDRKDAAVVPGNMKCVYKPFYALSIAATLNNQMVVSNQDGKKTTSATFTAPRARVLIVDDNTVNLQVALGLMQPYHMQLVTATSAKDAIRLLGSRDYDLVFMDHMMPEMDGVEATKLLREKDDKYYKELPIIALTANAVSGARDMFLGNGFNGFLPKPIELSALDKVLKQFLPAELMEKAMLSDEEQNTKDNIVVPEETKELIDVQKGLFYTGNNAAAYLSILEVYTKKGEDKINELTELHKNEDWKNYIIEAHALKSSSLSIGAVELSELAKELELRGKSGETNVLAEKNNQLLESYSKVLAAAKAILDSNVAEKDETPLEVMQASVDEVEVMIKDLKSSADSFDADAMLEITTRLAAIECDGKALLKYAKSIEDMVNDFEYDKAVEIAENMLKEIKG